MSPYISPFSAGVLKVIEERGFALFPHPNAVLPRQSHLLLDDCHHIAHSLIFYLERAMITPQNRSLLHICMGASTIQEKDVARLAARRLSKVMKITPSRNLGSIITREVVQIPFAYPQ